MKKLLASPFLTGILSLLMAAIIWLPNVHFLFSEPETNYFSEKGVPEKAKLLASRYIHLWTDPELRKLELGKMRSRNAEWDFMARSFLVWSLANIGMRDPKMTPQLLPVMDRIIDETIRLEKEKSMYFFLMPYAKLNEFKMKPARSQFLDGEIALMMAMRRLLQEKDEYKKPLKDRVEIMIARMEQSPVLSAESYPDECWLFCNLISLAATKVSDHLDNTDHSDFLKRWVETAKIKLVDPKTGMLNSSYNVSGTNFPDGPEGSSIWLAAHCLQIIDLEFAKDQFQRAKKYLATELVGFGYSYEWPNGVGNDDVDSGPIIPIIKLSAGATGFAFLGATSFGDKAYLASLFRALELGAFPVKTKHGLKLCAGNAVGDAVLLYALTQGPAWKKVLG